jgi:hypothetical protein
VTPCHAAFSAGGVLLLRGHLASSGAIYDYSTQVGGGEGFC